MQPPKQPKVPPVLQQYDCSTGSTSTVPGTCPEYLLLAVWPMGLDRGCSEPMAVIGAIDGVLVGEAGTRAGWSHLGAALAPKAKPNRDVRPATPVLARK